MLQYKVVTATGSAELEEEVQQYIKLGWTPIGGVSMVVFSSVDSMGWENMLFAQSMTGHTEPEEPK